AGRGGRGARDRPDRPARRRRPRRGRGAGDRSAPARAVAAGAPRRRPHRGHVVRRAPRTGTRPRGARGAGAVRRRRGAGGDHGLPGEARAAVRLSGGTMELDVTTLHGRRADRRWNRMAVGDLLERLTWSHPDKEALVGWAGAFADPAFARVTYREAEETANRVANALLAEGLGRGDRVLLFCDNSVEAVLTLIGIAKAGLVAAPVNPIMAPDVVAWAIEHVDARFGVVDGALRERAEPALASAGLRCDVTIPIGG